MYSLSEHLFCHEDTSRPKKSVFRVVGILDAPQYFRILVESGIYFLLREEEFRQANLDRLPVSKVDGEDLAQPIKLDGAISTLLVLCGATIVGAVLAFSLENIYKLYIVIRTLSTAVGKLLFKIYFRCRKK